MKPMIIHHNDADGKLSATIVVHELLGMFPKDQITAVEYNYGWDIDWDGIIGEEENGICYIVDVSMNDDIYKVINRLVAQGWQVIHIDHHKSTIDYLTTRDAYPIEGIRSWYRTDLSATMLVWVYSCMNEEERKDPYSVEFDFASSWSHVMINPNDRTKAREYRIPKGVFYVDDYDVWRHSDPISMSFHYGLMNSTKPNVVINKSDEFNSSLQSEVTIWEDILYATDRELWERYVLPGQVVNNYRREEARKTLRRGFIKNIDGVDIFCVNSAGGTDMFGTTIEDYDACIAYWYDGQIDMWRYSVRSKASSDFDCADFSKKFGGGGHKHAAGFQTPMNIINE